MFYIDAFQTIRVEAMRTTLNIDDELLAEAKRITGLSEKAALVREGLKALIERESAQLLTHPFVVEDLACGNLHKRNEILVLMQHLPRAPVASDSEVLFFIERHKLMGRGIGYIDAHLLASTSLAEQG